MVLHFRLRLEAPIEDNWDMVKKKCVVFYEDKSKSGKPCHPHYHALFEDQDISNLRKELKNIFMIPDGGRGKKNSYYFIEKWNDPSYVCKYGDVRRNELYTQDELDKYIAEGKKYLDTQPPQGGGVEVCTSKPEHKDEFSKLLASWMALKRTSYNMADVKTWIKSYYLKQCKCIPRAGDCNRYAYSIYAISVNADDEECIYDLDRKAENFNINIQYMPGRRIRFRNRRLHRRAVALQRVRRVKASYRKLGLRLASKTHIFKRFAQDVVVANTSNGMWITSDAGSQCTQIAAVTDDFGTQQGGFGMEFKINACIESTDFTQLFDRYKIVGVKLKFLYQNNMSGIPGTGATAPLPRITYAFDADDASVPANRLAVAVKGYAKERVLNGNRQFSVFIRPRLDKLVYQQGLTSAYSSERACWLDCVNDGVPHYGLKVWINNWYSDSSTSSQKLTIQPIYYLALKDTQ